jgi:ribonuclease BN (tRNA processing enzyme)
MAHSHRFTRQVTELWPAGAVPPPPVPGPEDQPWGSEGPVRVVLADEKGLHHDIWGVSRADVVRVDAAPLVHPVQSLGYIVTEATKPGRLDASRAAQLGVRGKDLGRLKAGEDVTVSGADGVAAVLKASDFLSPPVAGRRIVLLGDTCDSSAVLLHGRGFAAVVHESTFDDASEALAFPRGHSTARMAGTFAAAADAERLILTHFSQRFRPRSKDAEAEEVMRAIVAQAQAGFAGTSRVSGTCVPSTHSASCTIDTAEDFSVIDLRRK